MPYKILMVVTRNFEGEADAGRPQTLKGIVATARTLGDVELFRLPSLLEKRDWSALAASFTRRILLARPSHRWPQQCVLFDDRQAMRLLGETITRLQPNVVYLDTVRCMAAVEYLSTHFPQLRIVCDFDDLMSRRLALTQERDENIALGYIGRFLPDFLRRILESPRVARWITSTEFSSLRNAEKFILQHVARVSLVSSVDAAILRSSAAPEQAAKVVIAPPIYETRKAVHPPQKPLRFVFVGKDNLLQNRLSIEWLIDAWQRHNFPHPLYIYGKQSGTYLPTANVYWPGFVDKIEDIFTPSSILLAPSKLGGGIKTKMLQSISYGCLAMGNITSFEGIDFAPNPFAMTDDQLIDTLEHLEPALAELSVAAADLQRYAEQFHGQASYRAKWACLFGLSIESIQTEPPPHDGHIRYPQDPVSLP